MGGDVNLSMSGELHFGPEHLSPRDAPPDYARKLLEKRLKPADFQLSHFTFS